MTFVVIGHNCANCPRTSHNESAADTAEPYSGSPDEKENRATELVTAAKINLDKPQGLERELKEFQKELVGQ